MKFYRPVLFVFSIILYYCIITDFILYGCLYEKIFYPLFIKFLFICNQIFGLKLVGRYRIRYYWHIQIIGCLYLCFLITFRQFSRFFGHLLSQHLQEQIIFIFLSRLTYFLISYILRVKKWMILFYFISDYFRANYYKVFYLINSLDNFKIKQLLKLNKKSMLNELSMGQKIVMPKAILRTISLQKLRNPSPLVVKTLNGSKQNCVKENIEKQAQNKYQRILDKKLGISKQNQQNKQRLKNPADRKMSKKFQEFKKEVQQNQMKECTFKPTVKVAQKNIRSVNNFFNDQINYFQKKNDKIEQMRAIIQANKVKQNIFRPNALLNRNHKPEDIQKVHDRLYEDSKNKDKSSETYRQESIQSFKSSSITKSKRFKGLSRGTSIDKISQTDKMKNREMPTQQFYKISIHSNYENQSAQISSITSRKPSVEVNNKQNNRNNSRQCKNKDPCRRVDLNIYEKKENIKNQQFCIQKLMREIATVIQRCGLPLVFNYLQMNLFFQKMNFIPKDSSDNARKVLYEIWNMLQGEIFKQVSSLSIMKLVYAIMGCHNIPLVNKCIQQYWLSNQQKMETYDRTLKQQGKQLSLKQNLLIITERDSKTIKSTFEELYLNRLKLGQSELIKNQKANQYAFRPIISKASNQLAEKYRNRVLQESERLILDNKLNFQVPQDGQIDHIHLLMLDEKRKDALIQLKRQERERQKRKIEDQSMISLNQTERSSNRSTNNIQRAQTDRNQQLYQMGKNIHQNKKDKSTDEIQQERWKNELTFKPNLKSRKSILNVLNSKENYIPDYDKAVYRMHEGRKNRENIHSERNDEKNTSPLFYLNVVMQGCQSVKIPVFSQDNMKTITQKVRSMMDLQAQGNTLKLQKILKMQIQPALKQMGIKIQ